jgi:hypothetical protein
MPNRKISALVSSASAQASTLYPVVSGGNANKIITQHTVLKSLGIPQYVEGTCRATATVAFLPGPVNIFDIYVRSLVGSSADAGGSDVEIGVGNNPNYYATIATSGGGASGTTLIHAPSFDSISNVNRLIRASGAVIAAAPTATAASNFVVGIGYFRV